MSEAAHQTHSGHSGHDKKPWFSSISNLLALAALIVLAIIVLWGLIHILSLSWGWFASFFSSVRKDDTITVVAPPEAYSGESFALTWKYEPEVQGNYAVLFPCSDALSFTTPIAGAQVKVPCGSAYTFGGSTSSVSLVPKLSGEASTETVMNVLYIASSADTPGQVPAEGKVNITINPAKKPPVVTQKPTPATPAPTNPVYQSPADLSVRIVASSVDAYGNATVSFDVANIGGGTSGVYYFTAQLPTNQPYTYTSPAQAPLSPGSHITSTLNFSFAIPGTFTVSLSGANDINGGNDFASQFITAPPTNQYQTQPIYTPSQQPYYQPYYNNYYYNGLPYYINSGQVPYIVY